jgi:hypothetical protein
MSFKLKRFGGVFGKSPTTPHDEFETTDGFDGILNGDHLLLTVTLEEAPSGLYKLNAQIIKQSNTGSENNTTNKTSKLD